MRNLRGIIVAGVFGVLTWLVQQLAQRYSLLLDMAYPFASKTVQELLGGWSAGVDFCVWQVILAVFLVAVVVSIGLKQENRVAKTFEDLERLWDEYDAFERVE